MEPDTSLSPFCECEATGATDEDPTCSICERLPRMLSPADHCRPALGSIPSGAIPLIYSAARKVIAYSATPSELVMFANILRQLATIADLEVVELLKGTGSHV